MNNTPHAITVTTTSTDTTEYDWPHPADCPDGNDCDIVRRIRRAHDGDMAALVAGRPDGTYLLGRYYLHGLCLVDDTGRMLLDVEPPTVTPNGCHWCGTPRPGHGEQWTAQSGWHEWTAPTEQQIKARMLARRAATTA